MEKAKKNEPGCLNYWAFFALNMHEESRYDIGYDTEFVNMMEIEKIVATNFLNIRCLIINSPSNYDENNDAFSLSRDNEPLGIKNSDSRTKNTYQKCQTIIDGRHSFDDDTFDDIMSYDVNLIALHDFPVFLKYEGDYRFTEIMSGCTISFFSDKFLDNERLPLSFLKNLKQTSPMTISSFYSIPKILEFFDGKDKSSIIKIMNEINEMATKMLEVQLEQIERQQIEGAIETSESVAALDGATEEEICATQLKKRYRYCFKSN